MSENDKLLWYLSLPCAARLQVIVDHSSHLQVDRLAEVGTGVDGVGSQLLLNA